MDEECRRTLFQDHMEQFLFITFYFLEISDVVLVNSKTKRYLQNWRTKIILYTSVLKI